MRVARKVALGAATVMALIAYAVSGDAYLSSLTVDRCVSGKVRTEGKGAAAYTKCHAKNAADADAAKFDLCSGRTSRIIQKGFAKLESRYPACPAGTGNGVDRDRDTATFAEDVVMIVGNAPGRCDAAKQKCVGTYVDGTMGCYAKAANKTGVVDNAPGGCTAKASARLADGVKGCLDKAAADGDCTNAGSQQAALQSLADGYTRAQTCLLHPANPECSPSPTPTPTATRTPTPVATTGIGCAGDMPDGTVDPGEFCDDLAAPGSGACGADFTCADCNCGCPTTIEFSGDASDPATVLDVGTGYWHRLPIVSNGDVTFDLACSASSRPCGTCAVAGPIANTGVGRLDNQRCTNDTSIHCTTNAPCTGGGGTCEFFLGSGLPLAASGVSACVVSQFDGPVSGTANVESGEAATNVLLTWRVYGGTAIDTPCPRCIGDAIVNDAVKDGTCNGGLRNSQACDANGSVPLRPDHGSTSLDCPPGPGSVVATLPIDLSNATDPVIKTLSASSPGCTGDPGEKCLCDTCNDVNAEPCDSDGDCPDPPGPIGPICGGRRCIGGSNNGAACTVNSVCPMGGTCSRPGEPTRASYCLDDPATPGVLDCSDPDGDGEGECTAGPVTTRCSVASGHAQRGCVSDADCGGGAGSCESLQGRCFLTGGFSGENGTNTLIADGMEETPLHDVSHPTLGAVFCVAPTRSSSLNTVVGLPGPARVTIKGTATGHP